MQSRTAERLVTLKPMPTRSVVQGRGALQALPDLLDQLDARRALLITGRTLAERTNVVSSLRELLGGRLVGVFSGISQHTPASQVVEAAQQARRVQADCLISLGGGSPIDGTKAIAYALSRGIDTTEQLLGKGNQKALGPAPPHIALPTTLSAAECSQGAGFTDETARMKAGVAGRELAVAAIVYDPELTVHTPAALWAGTGMRAVDHAVETIYAPDHQPLLDVLALEALRRLFAHLPTTSVDLQPGTVSEEMLDLRLQCLQAAWFSYYGANSVKVGMSHALGRRIGAHFDVPHGVTSALTLPHVMRARLEQVADRLRLIAGAIGVDDPSLSEREAAEQAVEAVAELAARLNLPTRLRDVGIQEKDLEFIADGRQESLAILRQAL